MLRFGKFFNYNHQKQTAFPYIKDGLVFYLDGINKGDNPNAWTDLIGGRVFENHGAEVLDNGYKFNNNSSTLTSYLLGQDVLPFLASEYTIEICFEIGTVKIGTNSFVMFSSAFLDGVAAGFLGKGNFCGKNCSVISDIEGSLDFIGNYSGNKFTISSAYNKAISNGNKLTATATNCWGIRNNPVAIIGGRIDYSSSFNGIIHSIRIYNRLLSEEEMLQNQEVDKVRFLDYYDTYGYIKDGLSLHLDGINKGGVSGFWTDLVGGVSFKNYDATELENGFEIKRFTYLLLENLKKDYPFDKCTIEVCVKFDEVYISRLTMPIFQINKNYNIGVKIGTKPLMAISNKASTKDDGRHSFSYDEGSFDFATISMAYDKAIVNKNKTLDKNDFSYIRINVEDGSVFIGGNGGDYFVGIIHSIRIYDRLLTEEEMRHNQQIDIDRFNPYGLNDIKDEIRNSMLLWYSPQKQGVTNTNLKRVNILQDLSCNGRDLHLYNFAYTEQSGISENGALVFDGVDDYGIAPKPNQLSDYTIVVKRKMDLSNQTGTLAEASLDKNNGELILDYMTRNGLQVWNGNRYTQLSDNKLQSNEGWCALSPNYYRSNTFNKNLIDTNTNRTSINLYVGINSLIQNPMLGEIEELILFDRTLTEDELRYVLQKFLNEEL